MTVLTANLDFADVARTWRAMVEGSYNPSRQRAALNKIRIDNPDFRGASIAQMREWLDHGYQQEGIEVPTAAYVRPRRKLRFSEEGEDLMVDMALSGHDTPFLQWGKRDRRPGIRIDIELAMRATTPASVLRDYAAWLTKLATGLEASGYEMEVNVVSRCHSLYAGGDKGRADTYIKVKGANEVSDLNSWSAILSPGGFRMLVFMARVMNCEQNKVTAQPHMGGSFGPDWGLDWDPADRKLTVRCAASTDRFPAEQMDRALAQIDF